jgi:hypothetical protein
MWNNDNSTYGQGDRDRTQAKQAENKRNLILGLILAPVIFVGWVPVVWLASKVFK